MERIQNQNTGFAQLALLLLGRCRRCCQLCVFVKGLIWNRQLIYEKKKKGKSQWNWQMEWHTVLLISCPSLVSKGTILNKLSVCVKDTLLITRSYWWGCVDGAIVGPLSHPVDLWVTVVGQHDVKQSVEVTTDMLLPLTYCIGYICNRM